MNKNPAFLFYPNEWLGGTMGMTFEEKGAYISLLMMQFNRGRMTYHMIGHEIGDLWEKLKNKFVQDEDGLWYNPRLEIEQKKREKYMESRLTNREGINQYTKKGGLTTNHKTNHKTNDMGGRKTNHMIGRDEAKINIIKEKNILKKEKENNTHTTTLPIEINHTDVNGFITPKLFEKFWLVYPRKTGKGKALTKWNQLCSKKSDRPTWREIKTAILSQKKSEQWQNETFIPHPATWLNQSRWFDDASKMVAYKDKETRPPKYFDGIRYDFDPSNGKYWNTAGDFWVE